jgi:hypothetical protein
LRSALDLVDKEDDNASTLPARARALPTPGKQLLLEDGTAESDDDGGAGAGPGSALASISSRLNGRVSMRIKAGGGVKVASAGTIIPAPGALALSEADRGGPSSRGDGADSEGGVLRKGSTAARQVREAAEAAASSREQAAQLQALTQVTLNQAAKEAKVLKNEIEELKAESKEFNNRRLELSTEIVKLKVELSKTRSELLQLRETSTKQVADLENKLRQESEEHFALKLKHDVLVDMCAPARAAVRRIC